jgi:hypothetical protein
VRQLPEDRASEFSILGREEEGNRATRRKAQYDNFVGFFSYHFLTKKHLGMFVN